MSSGDTGETLRSAEASRAGYWFTGRTLAASNARASSRLERSRFSSTYETPDGVRRLSSSTRNTPSPSRMRSMPEMWMRTPAGGRTPRRAGRYCAEPSTTSAGMVPALRMRCSEYTSATKASSATTRCLSPRSSRSHSAAEMTRGSRQTGKIFSTPRESEYTEKVTPWFMSAASASACVRAKSAADPPVSIASTVALSLSVAPSSSSKAPGSARYSDNIDGTVAIADTGRETVSLPDGRREDSLNLPFRQGSPADRGLA